MYFCNMNSENNNTSPLISFIIPCYNLPTPMIRQCVESILHLSLRPEEREVIVIDDGSEHSFLDDLQDMADSIVYLRQPNSGPGVARNRGIELSSGQYIQFVDGDDWLYSEAYEQCVDIVRYQQPDLVAFQSSDKDTAPAAAACTPGEPMEGTAFMRHHDLRAAVWHYVFRKQILHGLRFTPGIYHEDEEFTPLLYLRAQRMFHTDIVAYHYRPRTGSITTSDDKRVILKRLDDMEGVIVRLNEMSRAMSIDVRTALRRKISQLTMQYLLCVMRQTRSESLLEKRIESLESHALFPLPDAGYTTKYSLFRKAVSSRTLRRIMSLMAATI